MCLLFLDLLISFYIVIIYKNLRVCVDIYIYIHTHTHMYAQNLSSVAGNRSTEKNNVPTKTIVIFQQDPSVFFVKKLGLEKHEVFLPDSIHFQQEQSAPLS